MKLEIDWDSHSKDEIIEMLKDLHIRYDERGMAMRETADMVRSLYVGSEVSKRIVKMKDEIEMLKLRLRDLCILCERFADDPRHDELEHIGWCDVQKELRNLRDTMGEIF